MRIPWDWLAVVAAGLGLAYAGAVMLGADAPTWPVASAGCLALAMTIPRGNALPRGLGAFLGAVALLLGSGLLGTRAVVVELLSRSP